MQKDQNVQEAFLSALRDSRVPVSVFLVNGIKLQGTIDDYDQFIITLKNVVTQVIFKHAISTILPSRPVKLPPSKARAADDSA